MEDRAAPCGATAPSNRVRRWARPKLIALFLASAAIVSLAAFGLYAYVSDDSVFVNNISSGTIVLRHCGSQDSRVIPAQQSIEFGLSNLHPCPVFDTASPSLDLLRMLSFPPSLPGGGKVTYPTNIKAGITEASCR